MEITSFLADSVVVESGKIYAQGAGWNVIHCLGLPTVHDRIGIGIIVAVPYIATNQQHRMELRLEDEDGEMQPLGIRDGKTLNRLGAAFNVGRPPQLTPGADQNVPFAINLNQAKFEKPGGYRFVISIDGSDEQTLPFTIVAEPTVGPVVE